MNWPICVVKWALNHFGIVGQDPKKWTYNQSFKNNILGINVLKQINKISIMKVLQPKYYNQRLFYDWHQNCPDYLSFGHDSKEANPFLYPLLVKPLIKSVLLFFLPKVQKSKLILDKLILEGITEQHTFLHMTFHFIM